MTTVAPGALLCERYRLERVLGTGGMASVWLARDEQLDRLVAVKVISDALALDERYLRRFEREAQVAARLSGPNLVKVFDFAADGERPLLVMEYVEGGSLADRLRDGRAAEVDPQRLAEDLLAALAHIHAAGILHRDVKPANVLLSADGRARLTDFGIAHPEDATRLTRTGQVIGTMKYLAPEVARGKPATVRSDLYSCGVVLSEAAAGRRLSASLRRLTASLTSEEPKRRPGTADEALAVLVPRGTGPTRPLAERGVATRTPTATLPSRIYWRQLRLRVGRRGALIAAVAAAILATVVVIIATAGGGGGSGRRATVPAPAPRSAPLGEQLDALDRAIDRAARR